MALTLGIGLLLHIEAQYLTKYFLCCGGVMYSTKKSTSSKSVITDGKLELVCSTSLAAAW
jgi:hypothetical protein